MQIYGVYHNLSIITEQRRWDVVNIANFRVPQFGVITSVLTDK